MQHATVRRLLVLTQLLACTVSWAQTGAPAKSPSPQQAVIAAMEGVLQKERRHVGALYLAARAAARMGDAAVATQWLDRLEEVGLGDQLDPDDFAGIAAAAEYQLRAARYAKAAPAVGTVQSSIETQCRDLLPEGTAWDPKRQEVLVSSGRQRTVFAITRQGDCRKLLPSADGGLYAVLGMVVEVKSDSLWVASTAAPFMQDGQPSDAGASMLARIDLETARVAQTWKLPGKGMLNDLALADDGSVYVTESMGGTVYRLAPGTDRLIPVFVPESFEGPNGIAALDGDSLVVADFHGLWLVRNPAGALPSRHKLTAPGDPYLGGVDGLAKAGKGRLVAVQNLVGLSRIWKLDVDAEKVQVQPTLLLRGHPDFRNPTTGVVADGQFHFIADPNVQTAGAGGVPTPLPPQRKGHILLSLHLP